MNPSPAATPDSFPAADPISTRLAFTAAIWSAVISRALCLATSTLPVGNAFFKIKHKKPEEIGNLIPKIRFYPVFLQRSEHGLIKIHCPPHPYLPASAPAAPPAVSPASLPAAAPSSLPSLEAISLAAISPASLPRYKRYRSHSKEACVTQNVHSLNKPNNQSAFFFDQMGQWELLL